jgi:multiple antibiotic resistance protein
VAKTVPAAESVAQTRSKSLQDSVFYPFTFPITAGPGTVVVMLTLSAHASSKKVLMNALAHAGILAAVAVLSLLVFICYRYAAKIRDRISPQTVQGVLRVIAFVLLCIGVRITWNGIEPLMKELLR